MEGKKLIEMADQLSLAADATATLGPYDINHGTGIAIHGLSDGNDCDVVVNLFPHPVNHPDHGNVKTEEDAVTLADGVAQVIATDNMKVPFSSFSVTYTVAATDATVLDLHAVIAG
jgi:hypothetical protein